jgi:hypothetical protein
MTDTAPRVAIVLASAALAMSVATLFTTRSQHIRAEHDKLIALAGPKPEANFHRWFGLGNLRLYDHVLMEEPKPHWVEWPIRDATANEERAFLDGQWSNGQWWSNSTADTTLTRVRWKKFADLNWKGGAER